MREEVPAALTALLSLRGLGPKRVRALHRELSVDSAEQLLEAGRQGRIRALPGFGEKTERQIVEALEARLGRQSRMPLGEAEQEALALQAFLQGLPGVSRVSLAGSFRRARESVGDLDVLVSAAEPGAVLRRLRHFDRVRQVLEAGQTRASVRLANGLQADVRAVAPESHGAALQYFTGSREHNIALRRLARRQGLKINEYGVFRGERRLAGQSEEAVYRAVGLDWVPPELRENSGEIEAARAGSLPQLIELGDLRGDLHAHSLDSDGQDSIEQLAEAAAALGLEYLAITEHSRRRRAAGGLDADALLRQCERIDALNAGRGPVRLLKGIEVDILEDGRLDLPDAVLSRLDLVVGAVHSHLGLSRARQTTRVLKAMDRPCFTLLAHPGGRRLGERGPMALDMERAIEHARERGCYLELDAQPSRLDLDAAHCRLARERGVLVSIDSDAHSCAQLRQLRFGINEARRGWLRAEDVLNTRPLEALLPLLRATMRAG